MHEKLEQGSEIVLSENVTKGCLLLKRDLGGWETGLFTLVIMVRHVSLL